MKIIVSLGAGEIQIESFVPMIAVSMNFLSLIV